MPAHPDKQLLKQYDPVRNTWNVPLIGEFWEAIDDLHSSGRLGDSHSVAIVDSGFDISIPLLERQHLHWSDRNDQRQAHGTAVALLAATVAPRAHLQLFPVSGATPFDENRVIEALTELADNPPDVVNLSFGRSVQLTAPDSLDDILHTTLSADGWRAFVAQEKTPLSDAVEALLATGTTVIAAAGNNARWQLTPAAQTGVIAAAFQLERRQVVDETETAEATTPSFDQALFADIYVRQPRHVLGSSFAVPLIAGLACLMESRTDLATYARAIKYSAMGGWVQARYWMEPDMDASVKSYYNRALAELPHRHLDDLTGGPCPACQIFAVDSYVNLGLQYLHSGDTDSALPLLIAACSFAPRNPSAAADAGVALDRYGDRVLADGNRTEARDIYEMAFRLVAKAAGLRPEYEGYARRAADIRSRINDVFGN